MEEAKARPKIWNKVWAKILNNIARINYRRRCMTSRSVVLNRFWFVVVTLPFREMEAWRKTMEPHKSGNFLGLVPEVVDEKRFTKN